MELAPGNSLIINRRFTIGFRLAALICVLSGCASSPSAPSASSQPGEAATAPPSLPSPSGFKSDYAQVNGVRLHYWIGGSGSPVVLLHGYAEISHMWRPIMPLLAEHHTVIVPDLRGAGDSGKPESGYDKKNMAVDIHELTSSLGFHHVAIVGHDIGLMVAYAYAAQFPQETDRLVLMDAFLPGIGNWKDVWLMRDLWHFHFYGRTPLALVHGRERIYFEHFWNDFAADPKHSVPEADRQIYAAAYAQEGGMRAGFEYFRNFEEDAADFAQLGQTKLTMPVLVLSGEKAGGEFLIEQAKLVATDVHGQIIKGSGHWLMEEAPDQTIPALVAFLGDGAHAAFNQSDGRVETSYGD
ncbi:MAG: alpha/beta hydrolase fold protein [Phycisphaerales bacterium]|nr:alpha/beta hydrolase fold protein [Phycisphaerales bacterium]MDB5355796.1 alpha/beta hydrolase fold protein [Phycisphaerales bacterium]